MNLRNLSVWAALGSAVCAHANIILNGDFESNTLSGTNFYTGNDQFTSAMSNTTGFGTSGQLSAIVGVIARYA